MHIEDNVISSGSGGTGIYLIGDASRGDVGLGVNALRNTIIGGKYGMFIGAMGTAYLDVSIYQNKIKGLSRAGLYAIDKYSPYGSFDSVFGEIRLRGSRSGGNTISGGEIDTEIDFNYWGSSRLHDWGRYLWEW